MTASARDCPFANVIALPLLLGVCVDNGLHMVHRHRCASPGDGNLLSALPATLGNSAPARPVS